MLPSKKRFFLSSLLAVVLLGLFSACDPRTGCDDPELASTWLEGQINGYDVRDCACCGGWYLETEDATYSFNNLPEGSDIQLDESQLPIQVKFRYVEEANACSDKGIKIILTAIELP